MCGERAEIEDILKELSDIRAEMVAAPGMSRPRLDEVHSNYRESARNFLHYLALRRHDLRPLQLRLAALGLSSLGRAESHVLAAIDAVMGVLRRLADPSWQTSSEKIEVVDFAKGQQLLSEHTETLFGPARKGR